MAHRDGAAVEAGVVKGVHRLTVLEHDVVGDIDDVVDGAHARRAQAHPQPQRRGPDLHVFDHARGVARAEVGRVDRHLEVFVHVVAALAHDRRRYMCGAAECGGSLAGKPDDRQAVGAVGRDLKLDHRVRQQQRLTDVGADLVGKGRAEDADAVLDGLGHVVRGQPQLADGAKHTERLHAAQLARLDVYAAGQRGVCLGDGDDRALENILRAGHDLDGLALSDIHRADLQVVGILMFFDGKNASDDDVLDVRAEDGVALDLGAGIGHAVAEFLIRNIGDIDEVGQPVS